MRRKPYTPLGLKRQKCTRCDTPARFQICNPVDKGWYPLCVECRSFLSELTFMFVRPFDYATSRELLNQYHDTLSQE